MSQENVEIVRKLVERFAHRQHEGTSAYEPVVKYYDADVEFDSSRMPMVGAAGVYRGREGVRAFWQEWLSAWSDLQFELEDVVDTGGDEVVALIRDQRQWGRLSGIETAVDPYGIVFTIRGGKVVRWCSFPTQEEALEAAGLSE